MKLWRLFILLIAFLMSAGCTNRDSDSYKQTLIPLADEIDANSFVMRFVAYDGGRLNYFVESVPDNPELPPAYTLYCSQDDGATWTRNDMVGLQDVFSKYPGAFVKDFFIDRNNAIYCVVQIGFEIQEVNGKSIQFPTCRLFQVLDHSVHETPNLTLGAPFIVDHKITRVTDEGQILIFHYALDLTVRDTLLNQYDPQTGDLKASYEITKPFLPKAFAAGLAFGQRYVSGEQLIAGDIKSGLDKPLLDIEDLVDGSNVFDLCTQDDGTVYMVSESGLYRLNPSSTDVIQLIDGADCRLMDNAWCEAVSCTNSGTFYAVLSDLDLRMSGAPAHTQLYRYQS